MRSIYAILVEDDIDLRHILVENLSRQGITAVGVSSALEFYQKLPKYNFDVAIIDPDLPDYSGLSIAQYLRKETQLGVIVYSDSDSAQDKVKAYESGADLYIVKPVDSRELSLAVMNLIARIHQNANQADDKNQTWLVDKESWRIVAPCNYSVELSAKEMIFVGLLGEKAGSTVSRSHLLDALSYPNNQHGNRALESMVLRLRKKLSGCESGHMPVKTVHGVGYMFSFPLVIS